MPGREHSEWYPLALIVATALTMFVLGSVTAIWLVAAPVPVIAQPKISLEGLAGGARDQKTGGTTATPVSQTLASPQQQPTSSATASAATAGGSPPKSPPTAAKSSPNAAAASASPASPQAGNFSLQLGAFLDEAKANSLAAQLAIQGYAPVSLAAADGYGRTWHYVRLGAFADERAAAVAASDLLVQAGIGAAVVRVSAANAGG
jgi:cell division protein FtsN